MKTRLQHVLRIAALLPFAIAVPAAAQNDDPVQDGHALVQMYCADCHATEVNGDSPLPAAPRFRELHTRYDVELLAEALVEGIVTHPAMPEFEFDPQQAEAIISYLKTLETKEAPFNALEKSTHRSMN